MDSAGAELMALAWRMKDHPEFAADAARVREIGAWASFGRASDMERMTAPVLGSIVAAMRNRGIPFDDVLPMQPQFTDFLQSLPDPLPGQKGYVDQTALPPVARRDAFEAVVDMTDVSTWTGADGVPRAAARACRIAPVDGIPGEGVVYADGAHAADLSEGATVTLWLRSGGRALRVVDALTPEAIIERRRKEPVNWEELVQMFHTLTGTLRRRLGVSIQDELTLEVEIRSFTCEIWERLRRSRQAADGPALTTGDAS